MPNVPVLPPETSQLTEQHRTTVPSGVRDLLDLQGGDQIRYIRQDGRVYVEAARTEATAPVDAANPVLGAILDLIAADVEAHPEWIQPFGEHRRPYPRRRLPPSPPVHPRNF